MDTDGTAQVQSEARGSRGYAPEEMRRSEISAYSSVVNAAKSDPDKYPITEAQRELIVNDMTAVIAGGKSLRARIAAAKVVATLDSLNVRRDGQQLRAVSLKQAAPPPPPVSVEVNVGVAIDFSQCSPEEIEALKVAYAVQQRFAVKPDDQ